MVGMSVPGACLCRTLDDRLVKFTEYMQEHFDDEIVCDLTMLQMIYDQCPGRQNLHYEIKTSRGGAKLPQLTIATIVCGLHNFPDKRFDEQNLQGQVSFSPRNDKPYIWNDPHKPKDLHELYPVKIACDAFSEKEYLDAGIRTYLKQRFDNGLSIGLCSTVSEESKEDAEIDITSSLLKRCSKCELQWPIGKQICMEPYGCGKALPAESVYKLGKGTKKMLGKLSLVPQEITSRTQVDLLNLILPVDL